ncbi:hypothetical protein SARC_10434 [Sphaeroforma arctica JP610]|uniref:Uncharacterized protein n=1 Tax=Sphaeroforma arctica JP610 TaxID=667725 RepID=A0A0L0FK04_9EUKA|nr:hypothetical protein SARC_10434 [Sphaeroforma arctica JP610]KNC77099.1 hypothetical protein SARC_10434 [Sphaeroforma arctica JP610]|eukprot:XP_014151001.1 hypothetical protein SARC_10434 [Sphaeroforma arctica JP610]
MVGNPANINDDGNPVQVEKQLKRLTEKGDSDPVLSSIADDVSASLMDNQRDHWKFIKNVSILQATTPMDPKFIGERCWERHGYLELCKK